MLIKAFDASLPSFAVSKASRALLFLAVTKARSPAGEIASRTGLHPAGTWDTIELAGSVFARSGVAEEDARRLHRERDRLVCERVQHVKRIKGLCALQGIYDYNPLRPQAMARLEQLRTAQGGALPARLCGGAQ